MAALAQAGTRLLAIGFAVASGWYVLSDLAPNTAPTSTLTERVSAAAVGVAILLRASAWRSTSAGPRAGCAASLLCCLPALASIAWLAVGALSHRSYHVAGLLPYRRGDAGLRARAPGTGQCARPARRGAADAAAAALRAGRRRRGHRRLALLHRRGGDRLRHAGADGQPAAPAPRPGARDRVTAPRPRRSCAMPTSAWRRVAERTAHLHELVAGLESFNRGVSHDLRGPLGGMAQLARGRRRDGARRRHARHARCRSSPNNATPR